ncbi:uncharacterized protein LOC105282601 isoform X2 [Ooceraea biroi]|uniref:uncharacterized protein LOC105282601 isoform X2 n=1 Tax=Ooceraea biroi TaxID=2015173 RepID=UPI0005BA9422|nr:uncharacterized protein LOC105282601 isoform X2 [Ooceraea biroi]
MLFYLLLIVASPFLSAAFPQMSQVDGFVFDGPTGSSVPNGAQRTTSTSTTRPTGSARTSTTTTSTLPQAQFDACVTSCPVTPEYNPVCGTDNMDYTNPGGLGCAQRCGKEVVLSHYGRCSTGRSG